MSASTVTGLSEELKRAKEALLLTDYSSASIQSASELFLRFISLISSEQFEDPSFENLMQVYKTRGEIFVTRISKSREIISRFARPFVKSGMVSLTAYHDAITSGIAEASGPLVQQGRSGSVARCKGCWRCF